MSYEIGTYKDLSYLNKKPARSSVQSAGNFLVEIGTSFKLVLTEAGSYRCARRINVSLA